MKKNPIKIPELKIVIVKIKTSLDGFIRWLDTEEKRIDKLGNIKRDYT